MADSASSDTSDGCDRQPGAGSTTTGQVADDLHVHAVERRPETTSRRLGVGNSSDLGGELVGLLGAHDQPRATPTGPRRRPSRRNASRVLNRRMAPQRRVQVHSPRQLHRAVERTALASCPNAVPAESH